jgi:metal-sulfur cluster biosynthetic enzyme
MNDFNLEEIKEKVILNLKHIFDPEIPVNIYDLGLIYNIELEQKGNYLFAFITMTLTSPGCPVADSLVSETKYATMAVNEVDEASVELTFDPPWDPSKVSNEGKEMLEVSGMVI